MIPDRWQEIKRIFDAALERAPGERRSYLIDACDGDDDLRREVESLLASFDEAPSFMQQPAVAEVADQIAASQVRTFSKGEMVAHYRIISELGTGGQGAVYKALDTKLGRTVALKLLPPEVTALDDTSRKRFRREAQLASSLDHPNICTVHDLTEADGVSFIVMQFVAGRNVRQLVKGRPLKIRSALKIAIQVCDALSVAHSSGIIHRDIKAQNIIVSENGQAKILDFGLAKLAREGDNAKDQTELTALGSPYGTPTYAAPEQSRGEKVDRRADIFSTGVLLYEMLSGTWPFRGKTAIDVRHAVLHDTPEPISEKRGGSVPAKLEAIVTRALSKEPARRYQQMSRMRDELIEVLRELPESKESSTQNFLEGFKPAKLHPLPRLNWKTGLAAVMAFVVVAILIYVFYSRRSTALLTSKDTIFITDFTNTTGDAVFDDTLKQGLAAQLQQSPVLNLLPDSQARQTLQLMNRSPNERMTREVAREICQRQELKALVAGTIAKFDRNYSLTLEAVNCQSGQTIALVQAQADGKDQVLAALSKSAAELREKLGESLSSIKKFDVPIDQLTTGSLDALKAYSLAFDRSNKGKYFESVPLFRRATELDPNFAYAYVLLAGNYIILTQPRHAAENAARAYALKDRVSDREKLYITNYYNVATVGDLEKSVEALEVYKRTYPNDFRPPGNLSWTYLMLGQFDKAVAEARESVRLNPNISAWHVTLGTGLMRLNRFSEAKEAFTRALQMNLDDARMHTGLYQIAFIENDATTMQQQMDWARGLPEEYFAADMQASAAAYAGQWRRSQESVRRAIDLATRVDVKEVAARYAAEQALLAAVLGRCDQAKAYVTQSLALERNQVTLSRAALSQAWCGNQTQSLIDELTKAHGSDTIVNGLWLPVIRAAIGINHGNAAKAVELLESARAYEPAAEFWTNNLRGEAYLKLGQGAEAAAEFQRILEHRGEAPLSVLFSFANLGLARAAQQKGDVTQAHKAYEDFLALWKDADPDLPAIQIAKADFAKLRSSLR